MQDKISTRNVSVPARRRFAVLMAGGVGTRFWPWSRQDTPKQLLALASTRSMLAETASRIRRFVPDENVLVVTGSRLRRAVSSALPHVPAANILCEPQGRNTAACVGWAAHEITAREPDGVLVVLPSDHVVSPAAAFLRALRDATTIADRARVLVTFGIRPTVPAIGYGYIQAGRRLARTGPARSLVEAFDVRAFHEKPSLTRARKFLASKSYYWNSGMFAWRADVILEEFESHLPLLARALRRMSARRQRGRVRQTVVDSIYPRLQSISIDHGVMEKSSRVVMLPAAFTWNDIGSWDAVGDLWPSDTSANASRDPLIAVDSSGNVVATRGKPVALVGVHGLAVVDSGDALLVCKRDHAQDVRRVVAALEEAGLRKLL